MRLLLVEDERSLREALVDLLVGEGHEVVAVGDGEAALRHGLVDPLDLVLLDLMLPRVDGMEVCRQLRAARPELGILMLTAKGDEEDKVQGLRLGADDYVTKPFGARELLARIEALGRRRQPEETGPERIEVGDLVLDLGMCRARRGGAEEQTLTAREVGILRLLHRHRGRAVSRGELLREVWEAPADLQTRTVDMAIANLRQKIEEDAASPRILLTVKGVGYAWGDGDP